MMTGMDLEKLERARRIERPTLTLATPLGGNLPLAQEFMQTSKSTYTCTV
jgi:hypothetical protein